MHKTPLRASRVVLGAVEGRAIANPLGGIAGGRKDRGSGVAAAAMGVSAME